MFYSSVYRFLSKNMEPLDLMFCQENIQVKGNNANTISKIFNIMGELIFRKPVSSNPIVTFTGTSEVS